MSDQTRRVKQRQDLLVNELGDEALLYDAGTGAIHVLNDTAKVIWELCDGRHAESDMVAALRQRYSAHGQETNLESDVSRMLMELAEKGLVISE